MSDLPPYDPAASCPKCGSGAIATKWSDGVWSIMGVVFEDGEYLKRTCPRCLYVWHEAPVTPRESEGITP